MFDDGALMFMFEVSQNVYSRGFRLITQCYVVIFRRLLVHITVEGNKTYLNRVCSLKDRKTTITSSIA